MVPVLIFYIHIIFLVYIFTKNFIEENFLSGFLSVLFVVVIFSVGWTISEFVMSLFMESKGLGLLFPRAAFSLILLMILELIFYRFYFKKRPARTPHAA
jgi:hypothetical protein